MSDYACCLAAIPDEGEDGATWDCDACGTRWVWMKVRTAFSWYRSKLGALV